MEALQKEIVDHATEMIVNYLISLTKPLLPVVLQTKFP
jgi:hypothetical protein